MCSVGPCDWPYSSLSREEVIYYLFYDVLGVRVVHVGALSNVLMVVVLPFKFQVVVGVACSVVSGFSYLFSSNYYNPLDC